MYFFNVFITNLLFFRENFPSTKSIKNCTYDKNTDPFCPIFRVGYILDETQQNVTLLADKVSLFQLFKLSLIFRAETFLYKKTV